MLEKAKWISLSEKPTATCQVFRKTWQQTEFSQAELWITARGVYEATLNGKRVGDFVLAPGWTEYDERLQVQRYVITDLVKATNELQIELGKGWYSSPMPGWIADDNEDKRGRMERPTALLAEIHLTDATGKKTILVTDEQWEVAESAIRFSEIYDGETYDAGFLVTDWQRPVILDETHENLIAQEGEMIQEKERVAVKRIFQTPKGETVVDFGQEVTGYVEIQLTAQRGAEIKFTHGEVLDKEGNFYNANYRSAKAQVHYICQEGYNQYHPKLTFFGFRYLKIEAFPETPRADHFSAIAIYSDIKQTGSIETGNVQLNQLISNIFWGQKTNFVDVPTDCPQRDERLGWTGDAQAFVKAASYNYDVARFFKKWLADLRVAQKENGMVPDVVPDYLNDGHYSAAWADAVTIIPWQLYQTYGDKSFLVDNFEAMQKWVDFVTATTETENLWTGTLYFGDWLGLDAPAGSLMGSSRVDFVASAFYANSTRILVETGRLINRDVRQYETLYAKIVTTFRETFPTYETQTEHVLALVFELASDPQQTAADLAKKIEADGFKMQTGFVGTPHILHALSRFGYTELAYKLLLRTAFPSWLYSVEMGATTVWEHWDGFNEHGDFWSEDMNSFNHYAYGSVIDWMYEEAAGIHIQQAGFKEIVFEPKVTKDLPWLAVCMETPHGLVKTKWSWREEQLCYEVTTPVAACVRLDGVETKIAPGTYTFWGK